ncbi:MAG: hypothetical protein JW866_03585 [Ignavibacteriales bacterium]|nr:hypothetical protein [Ignavibacteriales bacterium]
MKNIILFFIIFFNLDVQGNISSPIVPGTFGSLPFISQYVDILSERLIIVPDEKFETALFQVEYQIKVHKKGVQIPLLFYAFDYEGEFKVWLNDQIVNLKSITKRYEQLEGTIFSDFKYMFSIPNKNSLPYISLTDSLDDYYQIVINDLKYFEVDLSEGKYIIRVEYVAKRWTDNSGWVKKHSFRYALAPAKYWKSFGNLEIILDASKCNLALSSNLGNPLEGNYANYAIWKYDEIPMDILKILYQPKMNSTAKKLIDFGQGNIAIIFGLCLTIIHLLILFNFKNKNKTKRNIVVIIGSVIVPLFALLSYVLSFDIIDAFIGIEATERHGYVFMIMLLYPIILPVYWIIIKLIDKLFLKRLIKQE